LKRGQFIAKGIIQCNKKIVVRDLCRVTRKTSIKPKRITRSIALVQP